MNTGEDQDVLRRRPAGADGLRVVLAGAHSLRAMLGPAPPPSFAWLWVRIDRARQLIRDLLALRPAAPPALGRLAARLGVG